MSYVTFISALFTPDHMKYRNIDKYKEYFSQLAETGIPIKLYLNTGLEEYGDALQRSYANVEVLDYITFDKLIEEPVLPQIRNAVKDTSSYMFIQLMKLKVLYLASERVTTPYMAWIDFGIMHMMKNHHLCKSLLTDISMRSNWRDDGIYSPGSWPCGQYNIFDGICWVYSGSFLLGNKLLFKNAYEEQTQIVSQHAPKLTWEINYWSRMNCFIWYNGTHNETMLQNILTEK